MATPASITMRELWRPISPRAHSRNDDGRRAAATGHMRRIRFAGTCVAIWPSRVVPAAAAIIVAKIHCSRRPGISRCAAGRMCSWMAGEGRRRCGFPIDHRHLVTVYDGASGSATHVRFGGGDGEELGEGRGHAVGDLVWIADVLATRDEPDVQLVAVAP